MVGVDTALNELAAAHGVATWYRDGQRRRIDVDPDVVRRVLGLLGVDADTPGADPGRAGGGQGPAARPGAARHGGAAPGTGPGVAGFRGAAR